MKKALILICLLQAMITQANDVLILRNDMIFTGKITKIKYCIVVFEAEKEKYYVPASEIFAIEFGDIQDKVYTDYLNLPNTDPDKCMKGKMDAKAYHGKEPGHVLLGFLFGPLAMLGTALARPTPENSGKTYLNSKNKDLFNDPEYLKCYKRKAKGRLIGMEAIGWGLWLVIVAMSAASA